jgi:hypothetical protein
VVAPYVWQTQSFPIKGEQLYQVEAESVSLIFTVVAVASNVNTTESILVGSTLNWYPIFVTVYPETAPAPSPLIPGTNVFAEAKANVVEAITTAANRISIPFIVCVIFQSPNKKGLVKYARPNTHRYYSVIFGGLAVLVAFATVDP